MIFAKSARSKRIRENIRHFKNKDVDFDNLIEDFYLENGLAYISCNVRGIGDIVNPYSVRGYEVLNSQFAEFIDENAYHIPVEYPIVLEICGVNFTDMQQKTITRIISSYYALRLGEKTLDLETNQKRAALLLIMGSISFGLVWLLSVLHVISTLLEPALILLWFFIWEFGDLVGFERKDLVDEKTAAGQLASIKVIFRERFKDSVFDEQKSDEIRAEILEEDYEEDDEA